MPRELNAILQELNEIAINLDIYSYHNEASDIRSLSETIRTGGMVPFRVRTSRVLSEDIPSRHTTVRLDEFKNHYGNIPGFRGVKFEDNQFQVFLTEDADKYLFPQMFEGFNVNIKKVSHQES